MGQVLAAEVVAPGPSSIAHDETRRIKSSQPSMPKGPKRERHFKSIKQIKTKRIRSFPRSSRVTASNTHIEQVYKRGCSGKCNFKTCNYYVKFIKTFFIRCTSQSLSLYSLG